MTLLHVLVAGIGGVTADFAPNWPEPVLARALAARGHRVSALGYLDPGNPAMASARSVVDGIDVRRARPAIWPSARVAEALRDLPPPDIIHLFHLRNVFVANLVRWARQRHIPVIHSPVGPFHDAYLVDDRERPYASAPHYDRLAYDLPGLLRQFAREPKPRRQLTNYLLHAPLRGVDRFVASSYHEQEILQRMGVPPETIDVIPLWITPPPTLVPDDSVKNGIDGPLILFIGQLTVRKGADLLIEALPVILARHPAAVCVIVSHNPERQAQLVARAAELDVAGNLRFAGRVTEAQKLALMRAAACWVIPSRYEGFGLPLLEAMQAGVPLVTTNIPVIDEIVTDNEDGLLVAPENPQALAYAVARVLSDAHLRTRLAAAGRRTLADRFAEDHLLTRVLETYARARGAGRP